MRNQVNPYNIQDLGALQSRAGAKIASSIQNAAAKTGVNFSYLLQQAKVESNFKTDAKAKTSSATGLYQFIESTWLSMVNEYGDKYGLGAYADKISDGGRVASSSDRQAILALRKDPKIASFMAAEYAKENQQHLQKTVGGDIGSTELYLAHFMGPAGAARFLDAYRDSPNRNAAAAFPTEARANRGVFFDKDGSARSLKEVYAFFDKKFSIDDASSVTQVAAADTNDIYTKMPMRPVPSRVDVFDETKNVWVKSSSPEYIQATLALLDERPQQNYGGIPSLGALLSNPIDLLSIAELTDTSDSYSRRYNA
jgi:hypothetical protein